MAMAEAAIIPPMTVEPRMRRATAPEPLANHNGIIPKINAKEVIRIGRRRKRAPSRVASSSGLPFSYSSLGEFNNQDGVLCGQSDEHDQSDLRVDIVFHPAQPKREERAEHRDRRTE